MDESKRLFKNERIEKTKLALAIEDEEPLTLEQALDLHFKKNDNFSYNNRNIAVEHFAISMNSLFKKISQEIFEITVFYDASIGNIWGYWEKNRSGTFIKLNGCALQGEMSANWELARLLYHISSRSNTWLSNLLFEKLVLANNSEYQKFSHFKLNFQNAEYYEKTSKRIIASTDRQPRSISDDDLKDVWLSEIISRYISLDTLRQFFHPYTKHHFLLFKKNKKVSGIPNIFANELVDYLTMLNVIQ